MKNRLPLILEIVWVIVGIICLAAGVHSLITGGGTRFILLFIMALVSAVFAWIRHTQRKKF
jgi:hypothetical protein